MRRFRTGLVVLAVLSVGLLICGALYLNSLIVRAPFDLQSRLKEQGVELVFSSPQFEWVSRSLRLHDVSLSSHSTPWRANAKTCTTTALDLFNLKLELLCPTLALSSSEKIQIPAELRLLVDNLKEPQEADFDLTLQTPPNAAGNARLILLAKGHVNEQGLSQGNGTLEIGQLPVDLGARLEKAYESLRSLPLLRDRIGETPRTVRLENLKTAFKIENRGLVATNLSAKTDRFAFDSDAVSLEREQLVGKVVLRPSAEMLPIEIQNLLRGSDSKFGIPLIVSGTLQEPQFSIEAGWIPGRVQTAFQRGLTQETKQFLKQEYETKWKSKVQDFIKNRFRN